LLSGAKTDKDGILSAAANRQRRLRENAIKDKNYDYDPEVGFTYPGSDQKVAKGQLSEEQEQLLFLDHIVKEKDVDAAVSMSQLGFNVSPPVATVSLQAKIEKKLLHNIITGMSALVNVPEAVKTERPADTFEVTVADEKGNPKQGEVVLPPISDKARTKSRGTVFELFKLRGEVKDDLRGTIRPRTFELQTQDKKTNEKGEVSWEEKTEVIRWDQLPLPIQESIIRQVAELQKKGKPNTDILHSIVKYLTGQMQTNIVWPGGEVAREGAKMEVWNGITRDLIAINALPQLLASKGFKLTDIKVIAARAGDQAKITSEIFGMIKGQMREKGTTRNVNLKEVDSSVESDPGSFSKLTLMKIEPSKQQENVVYVDYELDGQEYTGDNGVVIGKHGDDLVLVSKEAHALLPGGAKLSGMQFEHAIRRLIGKRHGVEVTAHEMMTVEGETPGRIHKLDYLQDRNKVAKEMLQEGAITQQQYDDEVKNNNEQIKEIERELADRRKKKSPTLKDIKKKRAEANWAPLTATEMRPYRSLKEKKLINASPDKLFKWAIKAEQN